MTRGVQTQLTEERVSRADLEMLQAWLVGADFPMASVVRRLRDAYLAQQRVIEAARIEMEKHRHDVWCADYEAALAALTAPETRETEE